MKKIKTSKQDRFIHRGLVIPIDEASVDTDKIIPAQFLTTVKKQGLGQHLFARVRKENPRTYPLDHDVFKEASIMLCRPNFGCGSSREHAAWAIQDAGFKVLIGTSFLDIFVNNCQLNGIWILQISEEVVNRLFEESQRSPLTLQINMRESLLQLPWDENYHFEVDPFYRKIFMQGLDPIRFLGKKEQPSIKKFEVEHQKLPIGVFVA